MKCMKRAIYYGTKLEFLFLFTKEKGKDSFVCWLAEWLYHTSLLHVSLFHSVF